MRSKLVLVVVVVAFFTTEGLELKDMEFIPIWHHPKTIQN